MCLTLEGETRMKLCSKSNSPPTNCEEEISSEKRGASVDDGIRWKMMRAVFNVGAEELEIRPFPPFIKCPLICEMAPSAPSQLHLGAERMTAKRARTTLAEGGRKAINHDNRDLRAPPPAMSPPPEAQRDFSLLRRSCRHLDGWMDLFLRDASQASLFTRSDYLDGRRRVREHIHAELNRQLRQRPRGEIKAALREGMDAR